jgi:UTP:GlnB (protein PII) uridylyltransferase
VTAAPLSGYLQTRGELAERSWQLGDEQLLSDRMDDAIMELADPLPDGTVVVAIGGYGRRVMALHSDVDLLFLHTDAIQADVEQRVLRPLWDAKLKVGHLSNTPEAARVFAGTRLDAISTFLTARPVVGSRAVFERFWKLFIGLLEKEHAQIVTMLAAEERSRREAAPYRLMAADLKTGRGGIRSIDLLDWRRRLFSLQHAPASPPETEQRLRSEMTRARSAIHAAAGRLYDSYDFDLRERAASYLGMDVPQLGRLILSLQRETEQRVDTDWPEVRRSRQLEAGQVDIDRITDRSDLTTGATDAAIMSILPEWSRLRDTPHIAPFHRHPVGEHSLACLDAVSGLLTHSDDALVTEAATAVTAPDTLRWAALAHDVGKGLSEPHARGGAQLIADSRLPSIVEDPELLSFLVEHHLLLADLATRYDIDDPGVISWVADRCRERGWLAALYLLTIADSLATGEDTWNEWRSELVRRAYRRVERELRSRSLPEEAQVEVLADRVAAVAPDRPMDVIRRHLAGFGSVYRRGHAPEEIAHHIELASKPRHPGEIRIDAEPGNPATIIVITEDKPGLLLTVSGVLALNRMSITDARFATRSDGLVFDTFDIVNVDRTTIDEATLESIALEMTKAIRGGFDLEEAVHTKREAYRPVEQQGFRPSVSVEPEGVGSGKITIETPDRIGLIFDLGRVFQQYRMPIKRARVDTRAGIAYDVFWVDRLPTNREPLERDMLEILAGGH